MRVCITKRGVPIAEIVPVDTKAKVVPLKAKVTFIGNIVSPAAEEDWEAQM
jgi:antitoxin (DNA-binding transcriptional repressor) of toxin-antitoxin stability system